MSKPGDFIDIPLTTKATWQLDELNHALLYEVWQSAGFDSANIRVWYRPQGRILVTYVDASFYDADSAERGLAEYWRLLSTGGPATPFSAFGVPAGVQTLELRKATTTGQSGQILSIQHGTQVLIAVLSGNPVDEGVTSTLGLDMSEAAG